VRKDGEAEYEEIVDEHGNDDDMVTVWLGWVNVADALFVLSLLFPSAVWLALTLPSCPYPRSASCIMMGWPYAWMEPRPSKSAEAGVGAEVETGTGAGVGVGLADDGSIVGSMPQHESDSSSRSSADVDLSWQCQCQ